MTVRFRRALALCAVFAPVCASASPIGQEIALQVDTATYRHYLDNLLYTRIGDNKGLNGPEHDLCRDNIAATLAGFGLDVVLYPFLYNGQTYHNVVATQTGTEFPDSYYIVSAHYDTVNNPGADDDASGVAAFMEVARVLSQYDTRYSVLYIGWDREEQGLRGSTAWVNAHPGADIRAMIQLDMIAHDVGPRRHDLYSNAASAPLRTALMTAVAEYGNGLAFNNAGAATFSDHAPFQNAGYQACVFVENQFQQFGCYHQPCDSVDTPNYIDYDFACDLARTIAGYLADHAEASLPCPGDLDGDGAVGSPDLAVILGSWNTTGGPADLDDSGTVGAGDLALLLGGWGDCG